MLSAKSRQVASNGVRSQPLAAALRRCSRPSLAATLVELTLATVAGPGACGLMGGALLAGCGDEAGAASETQPISVMTRNLYLGAELSPLFFALTVPELATLAGAAWNDVEQSKFPERALVLAGEIADASPDVVALQEVTLFRTQSPGDWQSGAPPNATPVELDFLELLLQALEARGVHYQTAAAGTFTDIELPATTADRGSFDVRLSDRNVILVRDGLTFSPGPSSAFQTAVALPVGGPGGATLTLTRGYVTADVSVGSRTVRLVDSHLEVGGVLGRTQEAQASELMAALSGYGRPLILAGDFNSPADRSDTASYARLTNGSMAAQRFRDTWPSSTPGPTCCLDLTATTGTPEQRIDLVLVRGGVRASEAHVIQPVKTPSGLWPSDHLGVFAQLQLP